MFEVKTLSRDAIETLGQLYGYGPTWDGNIVSKKGRAELLQAGLAWHIHGYASLTPEGVRTAAEWDINYIRANGHFGWLEKRRRS